MQNARREPPDLPKPPPKAISLHVLRQALGIPRNQWEYIYFIRAGDRMKIGRTRDVLARVQDLQVGSADYLEISAVVHGDSKLEARIHAHFSELRIRGEWFRYEPPLSSVVEAMAETDRSDLATMLLLAHMKRETEAAILVDNPEPAENTR